MTELDYKRKASELLQKGRYDDAVAKYRELIETSRKKNPAILNLIGDIYVKQSAYEQAFESFMEASRLYAEEGLFHNGIAVCKKILRLDKDQTEVYGILGNLYARQALGMDCIKFLKEYGRRKEQVDEYPAALAAFAEACEVLTDCPEIHMVYGEMLERVGRRDDAATCYLNASQVFADKGDVALADQYASKARTVRGGLDAETSDVQNVADLMNLRTLDDDSPRSTVAPESEGPENFWGRPDEPAGLSSGPGAPAEPEFNLDETPWAAFDPSANPDLPPPPPLPGGGPRKPAAPPVEAIADPNEVFAEPAGLGGDGLTLDLGQDSAPQEPEPAEPPKDVTYSIDAPATPGDGLELSLGDLEEAAPLDSLPGVVMPGAKPAPQELPDLSLDLPAGEPAAPAASSESTPAPDAAASSGDEELAAFFETAATAGSGDEQAVVIGDDFELLREGGDVLEVIADFRAATDEILDLDDYQAHYDLGTTYLEMELFDEAAAEFEISARGDGWALSSQEMLGYCFLRKGQIDLAVKELEKGLQVEGFDERDRLGLLYNLGIARGVMDDEERAIAAFQRILEVDPDFRDAQTRLERIVQNSG